MRKITLCTVLALVSVFSLSSCGAIWNAVGSDKDEELVQGPPIGDIVTPFDEALMCLRPNINRDVIFSVGVVADQTGRQSFGETGTGGYFTQGGGEMIQSAMLRAGATVINRRNMEIPLSEARWGIRSLDTQAPTTLFISGSINTLDFIPGGGFAASIAGWGSRYRQNRILVGADIYMTDARTGTIVGGVPIQKQMIASEIGFGVGRFFGSSLINLDAGMIEREALNFTLRQMMSLATFELISSTMEPRHWLPCRAKLDATYGKLSSTQGAEIEALVLEELTRLRQTDPRAAYILEQELAGRSMEEIMKSLGEPNPPKPAAPVPVSSKPAASSPAASSGGIPQPNQTETSSAAPAPSLDYEIKTTGPMIVDVSEGNVYTRVQVEAPPGTDLRWGFSGPNLLVVALSHSGSFDMTNVTAGMEMTRIAGIRAAGNAARQALQIRVNCGTCGAYGEISDDGVLTLDIAESEERVPIDLTFRPVPQPQAAPSATQPEEGAARP